MFDDSRNEKLKKIISAVSNVAMGDFSQEIKVTGEDEFATLGMAINEMISNLKHYRSEMSEKIISVVSDIAMGDLSKEIEITGEDEFAALGAAINEMNKNLKRYNEKMTNKILAVVSDVSMGELSHKIKISGEDSFAALGMAINEMINNLRQMHKKLIALAETDALTNIANRRKLFDMLSLDIERTKRYSSPLSIAMIDLDHFKKVNDTYGHIAGDNVLKETVSILHDNIRKADVLGRYGGEEFIIIMSGLDVKKAKIVCEKIRNIIEKHKHPKIGQVTISIGLAEFCNKDSAEKLIARADKSLYIAKENGRNRVEVSKG